MRLLLLFLPRLFVGSLARFSPVETSGDLLRQGRRWSGGDSLAWLKCAYLWFGPPLAQIAKK